MWRPRDAPATFLLDLQFTNRTGCAVPCSLDGYSICVLSDLDVTGEKKRYDVEMHVVFDRPYVQR